MSLLAATATSSNLLPGLLYCASFGIHSVSPASLNPSLVAKTTSFLPAQHSLYSLITVLVLKPGLLTLVLS